jgi:hypothetical protein
MAKKVGAGLIMFLCVAIPMALWFLVKRVRMLIGVNGRYYYQWEF